MRGCYINNQWVDDASAVISARDRGLMLADGLFETLLVANNGPAFFDDHWSRFVKGCHLMKLPLPIQRDTLLKKLFELIERQGCEANKFYALRYSATRGVAERGVFLPPVCDPTFIIDLAPFKPDDTPLSLRVGGRVVNPYLPTSGVKCIGHLDAMLEREIAIQAGFDDVLLQNVHGYLASISMGNVFFLLDSQWVTAPLSTGVLPGTVRKNIIEHGLACEALLRPGDLNRIKAAFVCNSLKRVIAVSKINDHFLSVNSKEFLSLKSAYDNTLKRSVASIKEFSYAI